MAEDAPKKVKPFPHEVKEALLHPNSWIYRIKGEPGPDGNTPTERIVGAWKTDANGIIEGDFYPNPHYVLAPWLKR